MTAEVSRADLDRIHQRIDEVSQQVADAARDHDDEIKAIRNELHEHQIDEMNQRNTLNETLSVMRLEQKDFLLTIKPFVDRAKQEDKDSRELKQHVKKWVLVGALAVVFGWATIGFYTVQAEKVQLTHQQRLEGAASGVSNEP
jgi:hypothetical protein